MKFYRLASGFPTKSGSLLPTKRGCELPTLTLPFFQYSILILGWMALLMVTVVRIKSEVPSDGGNFEVKGH